MAILNAKWQSILADGPQRSSHAAAVLSDTLYIFSGEISPRSPVPNITFAHPVSSPLQSASEVSPTETTPPPRVGAAYSSSPSALYIHGGRGGATMDCLTEAGRVWMFSSSDNQWSYIDPASEQRPEERSYHAAAVDPSDGSFYIHAGCAAEAGRRLSDLWHFSLEHKTWERLADAPGKPRGGTSICVLDGKVYRVGGFDGKEEIGGGVNVFDPATNVWETLPAPTVVPPARSVSTLIPLTLGDRKYLLLIFGEGKPAPSSLGHAGAGKFFGDVWAYDLQENKWQQLDVEGDQPSPRGWFAAAATSAGAVVHGGLSEENSRLKDAWELVVTT